MATRTVAVGDSAACDTVFESNFKIVETFGKSRNRNACEVGNLDFEVFRFTDLETGVGTDVVVFEEVINLAKKHGS